MPVLRLEPLALPRAPSAVLVVALAVLAPFACSRKDSSGPDAALERSTLSTAPDAESPPIAVASPLDASRRSAITAHEVAPAEARRLRVAKLGDTPVARGPSKALLEKQFAGAAGPFDVQLAELTAAGRTALFVAEANRPTSDARPILLIVGDDGSVLWSREHPVAGILPPVGPVAVAAAPLGRVALAACDPPTSSVALRMWDDDGSPFADFQAMAGIESCDALSLLYWPNHGWLIVAARPGETRARLMKESGTLAWAEGVNVGVRARPGMIAAPSVAADTGDSFVLVQIAQPTAEAGSPFHALAFRYDGQGMPIWKEALDLGRVRTPGSADRVVIAPMNPGVRVTLPDGTEIDVRPNGDHVLRANAPR